MSPKQAFAAVAAQFVFVVSPEVQAQDAGVTLAIEKHAQLSLQGEMVIRIRITCGPFEGFEEFQQGFAGGSQEKSGAVSESAIDGMAVCDGVQRTHTARMAPFDAPFQRGPARANAALMLCMLVGEEQTCFSGSTARGVIISGPTVP